MRSKRFLLILLIFMVLIVSVGAISAADNSTVSNMSSGIVDSGSLNASSNSDNPILEYSSNGTNIKSDVHVTTNNGSKIQSEISNISNNNTVIYLDNQTFILKPNSNYGLFVDSNRNLTICGGYAIGDGKTSSLSAEKFATYSYSKKPTLLINPNSTVTLININFINHNSTLYKDYALVNKGKLLLINCTFDNNVFELQGIGDTVLINCTFEKNVEYSVRSIYGDFCNLFEMQNCTLINTSCYLEYVNESIINSSNFRNSPIGSYNSLNSTITNSVFDGGSDSAIDITNFNNYVCIVDNCTFSNIESSGTGAAISYVQLADNCINITNSKFNNNSARQGGAIYISISNGTVYLENCSFDNNSARWGGACYFDPGTNATLKNCTFNNNSALAGGSIYSGFYLNSTNCSYDGNSALYGGAIYGYNSTVLINGSIFRDNYALIAGGAVSSYLNSTVVDNSIFSNNSADVCGGAVVIGNSTETVIGNSNFTSNDGRDYGNDVYSYGSDLSLNNNGISGIMNVSNDTLSAQSLNISSDSCVVYLGNNTTGFCLEENFKFPSSYDSIPIYSSLYAIFNHTNLALNSLNYQKVGDYIKYIIINYYGKVPDLVLNYAIWTFTDNNYTDSVTADTIENIHSIIKYNKFHYAAPAIGPNILFYADFNPYDINYTQLAVEVSEIVNDALNAYSSGVRIPDHYVEVDENGTATLYDFGSIFSNYYQNFITFKMSNYTVVYDMNITKITNTPVVYRGNDASFDIVVANNGTMALYNVSIVEDSFDDLTYKSWNAVSGNWTYNFINDKHTWTLNDPLGVNQSARITVVFSTENATLGDKINTVIGTSNNTGNRTANNTTTVIENITNNTNNSTNETNNGNNDTEGNDNEEVMAKEDVKTTDSTGYPLVALIIALIGIISVGFRRR